LRIVPTVAEKTLVESRPTGLSFVIVEHVPPRGNHLRGGFVLGVLVPVGPGRYDPLKAVRAAGLIKRTARKDSDERRGHAASRGYDARWQGYSRRRLRQPEHALCVCCKANGVIASASVTDHVIPGRRRPDLFWSQSNHQSLCDACHNSVKKVLEARWEAGEIGDPDLRLDRPLTEFFAPI